MKIKYINFKEVRGLNRYTGLMFKLFPESALIFNFDKPTNQPIHSFFCRSFWAYWYDRENNQIESRFIRPFQSNIKPIRPYSKLIEIPYRLCK